MIKNGNRIFLVIAFIVLFIAGRYILLKDEVVEIPEVTVVTTNQVVESIRGSYCWHSSGEGVCVDTAAPHEIVKEEHQSFIKVKPNETIEFKYSQNPKNVSIQQWEQDYDYKEIATTQRFTAPSEKGTYIISSFARFSNGDLTDTIAIEVE